MRRTILALAVGIASLTTAASIGTARAETPVFVPRPISTPAVRPVWYDRWGRWHPPYPYYGYGYRPPPRYYAYGPPRPYWRHRRMQCLRYGWC